MFPLFFHGATKCVDIGSRGIDLAEEDTSDGEVMPKIKPETLLPDKKRPSFSGVPGPSTSARKKRVRKGAATRVKR
jgi:hypothetical protein